MTVAVIFYISLRAHFVASARTCNQKETRLSNGFLRVPFYLYDVERKDSIIKLFQFSVLPEIGQI